MATTDSKTPRITKAQRFADIKALLTGDTAPNGTTVDEALSVIDHELELLSRKNTSVDKRKAEADAQNAAFKASIVDFLAGVDGDGMTCTDIGKAIPALADFNTSKMSSLCNSLVKDGALVKATVKGKTLFRLA